MKYYTLSALISTALLPVVGYAQEGQQSSSSTHDVFWAQEQQSPLPGHDVFWGAEEERMSLSVEAFHGFAQKKLTDFEDQKLNVIGINARTTYSLIDPESELVPELFLLVGGQLGRTDVLSEFHAAIGGNLRVAVCDWCSLGGRVLFGLSRESVKVIQDRGDDIGALYGCGLGAEFKIGQGALVLGADYIASTAAPEFYDGNLKCEKQSYVTYSVGYKFFF